MKASIGITLFMIIATYVDVDGVLGRIDKADLWSFLLATG